MLSTKDIQLGSGKTPKTIKPGNVNAKILGIFLQPLKSDPNAVYLMLSLEGEDQGPEFEGFLYDKDQPNKGRAKGQVGKVRYSMYPYRDGVTKMGKPKNRDFEVMRALIEIANTLNKRQELDAIQARDIFEMVDAASKVFASEQYYYWCIAGSAYMKEGDIKDYTLSLPKYDKNYKNFELVGTTPSQVAPFNHAIHVEDKTESEGKSADVGSWGAPAQPVADKSWTPSGFEI
jgi:hypothetical protein